MDLEWLYAVIGPDGEAPDIVQMCVRAMIILVVGLIIVRLAGKRLFGNWGAIDIVISVVIGSNLSRALTGNSPFVATIAATLLLVLIHKLLTHAASRWPALGPLFKGKPRRLMADGKLDAHALRRSGLGDHDLQEALRGKGVRSIDQAEEAWLERDGSISVIKRS
jgi:uncharacterized membrane protein YcaP (DUF421 family)